MRALSRCGAPGTKTDGTAQFGAPVRNGSSSMLALAARSTMRSTPEKSTGTALPPCCRPPQSKGTRIVLTPPCCRRWKCSWLGTDCGTTPQNLTGSAAAVPAQAIRPEQGDRQQRREGAHTTAELHRRSRHRASSPWARLGRRSRCAGGAAGSRPRRSRSPRGAAIAIRIGTSGEDEPPSSAAWVALATGIFPPRPVCPLPLEPLPGLPCPVPPPLPPVPAPPVPFPPPEPVLPPAPPRLSESSSVSGLPGTDLPPSFDFSASGSSIELCFLVSFGTGGGSVSYTEPTESA